MRSRRFGDSDGRRTKAAVRSMAQPALAPPPQQFVLDFGVQTPYGAVGVRRGPGRSRLSVREISSRSSSGCTSKVASSERDSRSAARSLRTPTFFTLFYTRRVGHCRRSPPEQRAPARRAGTPVASRFRCAPGRTSRARSTARPLSLLVNGAVVSAVASPGPPAETPTLSSFQLGPGPLRHSGRFGSGHARSRLPKSLPMRAARSMQTRPGLVADWPMDEGSGGTVHDAGPNHADIQMPVDYTTDIGSPRWIHDIILETGPYFSFEPYQAPLPVLAAGFIDFNNDGFLDILAVGVEEGPVTAFVNDGHGHFSDATSSVFGGPAPTMVDPRPLSPRRRLQRRRIDGLLHRGHRRGSPSDDGRTGPHPDAEAGRPSRRRDVHANSNSADLHPQPDAR